MFRILFIFIIILLNLNSKNLSPSFSLQTSGGVNDMVVQDSKLYSATSNSSINIFDLNSKTLIKSITTSKIKDFMGDEVEAKVYSVDVKNDSILFVSQGEKGGRNIFLSKNDELVKIISDKDRLFVAKAKFIDENKIIYALLSNEIFIFDLKEKKVLKEVQVSHSKFSNFVLTQDKTKIIVADESGNLKMYDTNNLELITTFDKQNVDNVFQVDTKNEMIITAGQDRRCAIYSFDKKIVYYKEGSFLIYSAALSPSTNLGAFASNEENEIIVFNTKNKSDLYKLKENKATITNIIFLNEKEIIVSSDDNNINYYILN